MKTRGRIVAFLLLLVIFAGTISPTVGGVLNNIKLGLDLQGGFEVLYQVEELQDGQEITDEIVADTASALTSRIDVLGVSEPSIQIENDHRIRVQLAGVEDQESARELLSTQANLTFRDSEDNIMLDGMDLKEGGANPAFNQQGQPIVTLELKDANKFAEITEQIAARPAPDNVLVIWLDFEEGVDSYAAEVLKEEHKFISDPRVSQRISSESVEISGAFSVEETKDLSGILNAGALPVKLTEIFSTSVGAQFGEQALDSTILASIIGVAAIFLFMIFYYRLPGAIAVISLVVYIFLILVIFDWINGVLTLPGIAAIVLGVGMAVDANILTYERIREELRVGNSVKKSFEAGAKSSFSAIFDANVTTLLAAVVLFYFGTSSVKGFATLLIISILVVFITAVFASRILLGLLVHSGYLDNKPGWFGISKKRIHPPEEEIDTLDLTTKFDRVDFVHNRKIYYTASIILTVAGIVILSVFKLNLGIDFSSGTRVQIDSTTPLTQSIVTEKLDTIGLSSEDIVISGDNSEGAVVRYKDEFTQEEIKNLKADIKEQFGAEPQVSTVSPTVGKELAANAMKAMLFAAIGIIIYVAFRFEWRMGVAAIASLIHDVFLMVAIFSILRLEVDITFIAAILTIVGYSINDTIVTFDRIRENLHRSKTITTEEELASIVNKSLRQTLGRSVNTVLTVVLVVVALLLFGAEGIRNFSIALLIGLLAGTYSSLFIATQIWFDLKARELRKTGGIKVDKEEKKWGSDEPVV
ncbi:MULTISPECIES: protein translocase subunit SecDF [unclassified Psychrobacillus]|uniref:protein translocase subunit SecDF n=1 Tax=unclassified Psychrobacillus TaxID=2636677 RepID=UPI00146A651C|nr:MULTISPECIES: protein translocase subunit SecDF [unclassified Psychrobacillus]MCM3358473.1 protein translocase subunit SecDF [Psychrobacillus sp. MER TA 171]NME04230.1 protein translocase subunit SecDF [Psychrobacillus sp. BL-248-WT-3]